MKAGIQCAAYYFPNYHVDPRNESVHGKGWTEWEVLKVARPRFLGHEQPKIPLWGYENEADPEIMARKISAAADHGIDSFVFDWYWYDGPFLQRALENGFLKAENRERLSFALMWANHDWKQVHPTMRGLPPAMLYPWSSTPENIETVWDYLIEHYFSQPNYWKINGKLYFSIYQMNRYIRQMGGSDHAARTFDLLRKKIEKAGLPELHLNAMWFDNIDSQPDSLFPSAEWKKQLNIDSYSTYNAPYYYLKTKPFFDQKALCDVYLPICREAMSTLPAPYYPVLTSGWDMTPRIVQSDKYEITGVYPFNSIMKTTPESFSYYLNSLCHLLETRPESERILFINAWNEWTEGSYLEPDTVRKFTLLEILQETLCK